MNDKEDMADNAALSNMCERPGGHITHRSGKTHNYFTTREQAQKIKEAQTSRNIYF